MEKQENQRERIVMEMVVSNHLGWVYRLGNRFAAGGRYLAVCRRDGRTSRFSDLPSALEFLKGDQ